MPDLSAFTSVATAALPATLTFLYQRLDHLLNRRQSTPEEEVSIPPELVGELELPLQAEESTLEQHRFTLETLHDALDQYHSGKTSIDASDDRLLRQMGRLRRVLEDVYGQTLTFAGEQRPASGSHVQQKVNIVTGEVRGMDAEEISDGSTVSQEVETVEHDSIVIGMRARRIGAPRNPPA